MATVNQIIREDLALRRGEDVQTGELSRRLGLAQASISGIMREEVEAGRAVRLPSRGPGWYHLLS